MDKQVAASTSSQRCFCGPVRLRSPPAQNDTSLPLPKNQKNGANVSPSLSFESSRTSFQGQTAFEGWIVRQEFGYRFVLVSALPDVLFLFIVQIPNSLKKKKKKPQQSHLEASQQLRRLVKVFSRSLPSHQL